MKPLTATRRGSGRPLRRRRQMRTRRRWTWRSLFRAPIPHVTALVLVLGGLYLLATSSVFAISRVEVYGDNALPVALVSRTCRCVGSNIFLTRTDDVRRRLSAIAWLDVRNVYARLPDRLAVEATFRPAIALWRTPAATYAVDSGGLVLYDVSNAPVPEVEVPTTRTVPLIYDATTSALASGEHVPVQALQELLQARRDMPADLVRYIDRYRWIPAFGLYGHSTLGWWFALGFSQGRDLQEKLNILDNEFHVRVMKFNRCNFVDLRPGDNLYCRYILSWHFPFGPGTK